MCDKPDIDPDRIKTLHNLACQNFWATRFFFTQNSNAVYRFLAGSTAPDATALKSKMHFPGDNAVCALMHLSVELFLKYLRYQKEGIFEEVHDLATLFEALDQQQRSALESRFSSVLSREGADLSSAGITSFSDAVREFSAKQIKLRYGEESSSTSIALYYTGVTLFEHCT